MGDRTCCTLDIFGALDANHVPILSAVIAAAGPDEGSADSIAAHLHEGVCHFSFTEVNYAELDGDLCRMLEALNLGYAWTWEAGGGYPEGITFFDPDMGEASEDYFAASGEICLTLRECRDVNALARAESWNRLWRQGHLYIFESRHDLLRIANEHGLSSEQVQRALNAKIP